MTHTTSNRPFQSRRHRLGISLAAWCAAGALTAVATAPQTAKADHPVLVAGIAAGASLGGAVIAAGAALGVAVIGGAAGVAAAVIVSSNGGGGDPEGGGDEGGGDEGGGDDGGGGDGADPQSSSLDGWLAAAALPKQRRCGASFKGVQLSGPGKVSVSAVPKEVIAFMKREVAFENTKPGANGMQSIAKYSFDGDVMKSPAGCDYIENRDTITWNLTLKKNPTATSDYFLFNIDQLDLTTTAVPKTVGHSAMEFTAFQNGTKIWSWKAVAHQGKNSVHGPIPNGAVVTKSTGELHVSNFWTTIPIAFAKGKSTAEVKIIVKSLGKGRRT